MIIFSVYIPEFKSEHTTFFGLVSEMWCPEQGGIRTQRAVVALCSPVLGLMPSLSLSLSLSLCLSVSLSLFGVDSAAACWISSCSSSSSSSSGHGDQRPADSQHPAADGGLPHPGSHSPPHSSAAPGVVSSRVVFVCFFSSRSPEQRGTQKWNLFFLIFLFSFFSPPVFLQPSVVCAERQALNSISSPFFFSFTRSAVTLSVTLRISPSLFLGFHNASGSRSEGRVDFIPRLSPGLRKWTSHESYFSMDQQTGVMETTKGHGPHRTLTLNN